ncbi:hypothetical protein VFPPC_14785 [Pochonia chlamydosporia 170]|uniref:Uncharacterized protein n=1 Tax=Pochonia chlamydosporia 170 TaxID=1380566 RepID=A0A179F3X5_METCM|nr:hypothetical protein VFPPC_14785 [Pochonia chlamydosporia 170]OAQ60118.1 hypothetical protein VFPPC_14785 [Pochonia chlamydosporia 170]
MPQLVDITYSEEVTIAAVRDYYDYLARMYMDDTWVKEPPEEGWPAITVDYMRELGKSDKVISLLKHLPYLACTTQHYEALEAVPYCAFADWPMMTKWYPSGPRSKSAKALTEGMSDHVPPHVVGLVDDSEDRAVFLLDTELGIVHWVDCESEIIAGASRDVIDDDAYDYASEEEGDSFRGNAGKWAIDDFFEVLKGLYRQLKFIPVAPRRVISVYSQPEKPEQWDMLQRIYREHGWPDMERYRKEECMDAIQEALKQHYPDELY